MKYFYFESNGAIRIQARLTGAYRRCDGELVPAQFELLGVQCGDPNGKYKFPAYWWNEAKACGGYFHLVREDDIAEAPVLWPDGSVLAKAEPHQQEETEDFFCEIELGSKHLPPFPIRLPSFGSSAKERLWSKDSIRRWEYRSGEKVVFTDGKTLDQRETDLDHA